MHTALLALLLATHYQFHISLTNIAEIAKKDQTLHLTAAQLEKGGQIPLYWLNDTKNIGWRWIVINPPIEQPVNFHNNYVSDISFKGKDDTSTILRCLHDECDVEITTRDLKHTSLTLHRDETKIVPLDADYDFVFKDSK
jgi:hypothetical protein